MNVLIAETKKNGLHFIALTVAKKMISDKPICWRKYDNYGWKGKEIR